MSIWGADHKQVACDQVADVEAEPVYERVMHDKNVEKVIELIGNLNRAQVWNLRHLTCRWWLAGVSTTATVIPEDVPTEPMDETVGIALDLVKKLDRSHMLDVLASPKLAVKPQVGDIVHCKSRVPFSSPDAESYGKLQQLDTIHCTVKITKGPYTGYCFLTTSDNLRIVKTADA